MSSVWVVTVLRGSDWVKMNVPVEVLLVGGLLAGLWHTE